MTEQTTGDRAQKKYFQLWIPDIYELKGGIQVYSYSLLTALRSLYPDDSFSVFVKNDSRLDPKLPALPGVEYHFCGNVHPRLRTIYFSARIFISNILKKPDLVISTHIHFAPLAYILKRISGIRYWVVVYGIETWGIRRGSLKQAVRNADRVLSMSHYTRDRLLKELALDPLKAIVLPGTFDAGRFTIRPKPAALLAKYGLTGDRIIMLTVGRMHKNERYKGYDTILRALPTIRQQIPNICYLLVGSGDDMPRIEQNIKELGVSDCVRLAGYVHHAQISEFFNACDVFVMPSRNEGFGIVYIEAMACGKPVVAGNKDGSVDPLCHGELGALVDPDDLDAITEAIVGIVKKAYPLPILYQPDALRQKAIDTFGYEQFKRTLLQHMKEE